MITELMMDTGMAFDAIMKMRTNLFAMFVKHSRKVREDRTNQLLSDLCDVSVIALCNVETYRSVKDTFRERLMTEAQLKKRRNPLVFDVGVKEQADSVANILAATFRQKAKLMGFGRG